VYFTEYRRLQLQIGIDDTPLCQLTANECDESLKTEIETWS